MINTGTQILDFDTQGNMKSTRDLQSTIHINSNLFSRKNVLHFNNVKKAFQAEISYICHSYGLILVGFKSGDFYSFKSGFDKIILNTKNQDAQKQSTLEQLNSGLMQRFNGPITKIQIFGPKIIATTTNELIIMNNRFNILKRISMITKDIELKVNLYAVDLSSLRIYDTNFNEIDRVLGRFGTISVNCIGDTIILSQNQTLIKYQDGRKKELNIEDEISGTAFSPDEKLLLVWNSSKLFVVNVENMIILQELYSGQISSVDCHLVPREYDHHLLLSKKRDCSIERFNLIKKFKPSGLIQKQNQELFHRAQQLEQLNNDLLAQLKSQ